MNGTPPRVLLAGDAGTASTALCKWMARRGCHCQFAASFEDVRKILSQAEFDLVLCQYALPDRTAFPLLEWLAGTRSTLLYSADYGEKARWLPVIERGQRCLDRASLGINDLPDALAGLLAGQGMKSSGEDAGAIARSVSRMREMSKENRL
jgi:CheY-like chemotaxis protein